MNRDDSTPPTPIQVQVELDPEIAQGMYVNMAMVNYSENEFTLDFIYVQPQGAKAKVRSRVISGAKHTKRLLMALQDSVKKYEQMHGTIDISGPPMPPSKILN